MASGSTSIGMKLDLSQRNIAGVIARIYSADRECQAEMRAATRAAGEFCRSLTATYAPKDTGFMASRVKTVYSADELSFETGWDAADFANEGLPFYPPFQEFGTRFMAAQPSLTPAYRETQRYYTETVRAGVRSAIARARRARAGGVA